MSALSCISPIAYSKFLNVDNIIKLELLKFGWKLQNHELPLALTEMCSDRSIWYDT